MTELQNGRGMTCIVVFFMSLGEIIQLITQLKKYKLKNKNNVISFILLFIISHILRFVNNVLGLNY